MCVSVWVCVCVNVESLVTASRLQETWLTLDNDRLWLLYSSSILPRSSTASCCCQQRSLTGRDRLARNKRGCSLHSGLLSDAWMHAGSQFPRDAWIMRIPVAHTEKLSHSVNVPPQLKATHCICDLRFMMWHLKTHAKPCYSGTVCSDLL